MLLPVDAQFWRRDEVAGDRRCVQRMWCRGSSVLSLVVTLLAGRYEVGAELGAGGYSRVLRAHDRRLGRDVAVKLLDVGTGDPSARERFLREALIGGRINHPNAVTVFDTGDDGGTLYITMELVEGEDLARRLRRVGSLPPDEAVAIAAQVLAVLEVAHDHGIIHRDVKPSNILMQSDGTARLADFGIARPLGELTSGLTKTGQIIGTAKYLSPEQAAGAPLTPATDLYSTGVVLYEMLVGDVPFDGDHAVAIALAHQQQDVPSVRGRAPHVDGDLAAVVERSLSKDASARYAGAASMRAALSGPSSSTAALSAGATATTAVLPGDVGVGIRSHQPVGREGADPPPVAPSWFRLRSRLVFALVAGVVIVAIAIAIAVLVADESSGPENLAAGDADTTLTSQITTPEEPAAEDTAPVSSAATLATLGELADQVAADPGAYGEKGSDLLDKLQEVQREKSDKQADKAAKVLEEIDKWIADGKLDAAIAEQARAVLRPLAES